MHRTLIIIVATAALAVAGCGGTTSTSTKTKVVATKSTPAPTATPQDTDGDGVPDSEDGAPYDANTTEAAPQRAEPDADGDYNLSTDYELGDFGDSGDPSKGYRLTASGYLINTGNVGIRVRVTYRWYQGGGLPAIKRVKIYKVRRGETREVGITVPATSDQIDAIQNMPYDHQGSAKATIIGTFGQTPYEDA